MVEELGHLAPLLPYPFELIDLSGLLVRQCGLGRRQDVLPVGDLDGEPRVRSRERVDVCQSVRQVRHVVGVQDEVDVRCRPRHVGDRGSLVEPVADLLVASSGSIQRRLCPNQIGGDLLEGDLLLLDLDRGVVQTELGPGKLGPDVVERVLDPVKPLPRALHVLLGGRRGAGNGPGDRYQHQEGRHDGGTRGYGEVSLDIRHLSAPARGKVGGPARTACQVPGPLATILGEEGRRVPPRGPRSVEVFDQLQGVAVGIVERGESSEPGDLRLVPVEVHSPLLQSPSRLVEVIDPEHDRPTRRE